MIWPKENWTIKMIIKERKRNRLTGGSQRGSLLLEALLSVVILSVSIALIIQSMTAGMRAAVYSQEATIALVKLENFLTESKSGAASQSAPPEDALFILDSSESTEDQLKRLDSSVRWKSGNKIASIAVSSYSYAPDKK